MQGRLPQEPRLLGGLADTFQRPTSLVQSVRSGYRSQRQGTLAVVQAANR